MGNLTKQSTLSSYFKASSPATHVTDPAVFGKDTLIAMLEDVGRRLAEQGVVAEIAIYGGSAIMLMFDFRKSTRDADYVPITGDMRPVAKAAELTSHFFNVSPDWLNDSVEIFKSDNADHRFFGDFPKKNHPPQNGDTTDDPASAVKLKTGLRVFTAVPEYIFAMKALAMRSSMVSSDCKDMWDLADVCGVKSVDDANELVNKFYPKGITKRNQLVMGDLITEKVSGKKYSAMMGW